MTAVVKTDSVILGVVRGIDKMYVLLVNGEEVAVYLNRHDAMMEIALRADQDGFGLDDS